MTEIFGNYPGNKIPLEMKDMYYKTVVTYDALMAMDKLIGLFKLTEAPNLKTLQKLLGTSRTEVHKLLNQLHAGNEMLKEQCNVSFDDIREEIEKEELLWQDVMKTKVDKKTVANRIIQYEKDGF